MSHAFALNDALAVTNAADAKENYPFVNSGDKIIWAGISEIAEIVEPSQRNFLFVYSSG